MGADDSRRVMGTVWSNAEEDAMGDSQSARDAWRYHPLGERRCPNLSEEIVRLAWRPHGTGD